MKLFDIQGRMILTLHSTELETNLDISECASGTYTLVMKGEKEYIPYKIVKL
jgi:hypothetical protein